MRRLAGLSYNDKDKLFHLLSSDNNFTYDISEGGFYTHDDIVIGIDRSPYQCCLYALSEKGEHVIDKWHDYILKKWNEYAVK